MDDWNMNKSICPSTSASTCPKQNSSVSFFSARAVQKNSCAREGAKQQRRKRLEKWEGGAVCPQSQRKGVKMEESFEKIKITEEEEEMESCCSINNNKSTETIDLLRRFLGVQQRRAEAYAKLRSGFNEYMVGGGDLAYQQVCREITEEFNDCSKQVLEIESLFLNPDFCRDDLALLLRSVQGQEKEKLNLTVTIQVLKKAGRPSERPVSHENCRFRTPAEHECMHVHEITVAAGTEEVEADADYDGALKEAIRGVQDAVMSINEHLEEVRYEIEALQAD